MRKKLLALLAMLAFTGYVVAGEINDLSTTDASNTVRWPENMAPSRVNNSARELEGILSRWHKDINGSIIAYGPANAIRVTPNRAINSLYDGLLIAFDATLANTGSATLQVATLTAKTIKKSHDVNLASGDLESGMKVMVAYSLSEDVFQLLSAVANAPLTTASSLDDLTDVDLTGKAVSEVLAFAGGSGSWISRSVSELGGRIQGKNTIWVPAAAMIARTSTGAASGTVQSTTNLLMQKTLDFDRDTNEFAQFNVAMPKDWNQSTVTGKVYWTSTNATGSVIWYLQGVALRDDDVIDTAFGTAQGVTDTALGVGDLMIATETSAVTLGGTVGSEALAWFQIYRAATESGDTSLVDAKLLGIKLFYTTNAGDDT